MYFAILTAALALCWLRSREGCCVSRDIVFPYSQRFLWTKWKWREMRKNSRAD